MKKMTTAEAACLLKTKGVRYSHPRAVIYAFMQNHKVHPGAEWIYSNLAGKYPNLSLTTVYNTLKLFVRHGLVVPLTIEGDEIRYDVTTEFHAHFKCRHCGEVTDCMIPPQKTKALCPMPGYQLESAQINYFGLCPACRKVCTGF